MLGGTRGRFGFLFCSFVCVFYRSSPLLDTGKDTAGRGASETVSQTLGRRTSSTQWSPIDGEGWCLASDGWGSRSS